MNKHKILTIIIVLVFFILPIPMVVFASNSYSTKAFGGKVLMTSIEDVTCTGSGTGPVVLLGNLVSVGQAVYSTTAADKTTKLGHVAGVASGIYNAIPFYTTDATKTPQQGKQILGNADIVPDFSTCYIQIGAYKIPFPVKKTSKYNVSGSRL